MVLKSAVSPVPSATTPFNQFVASPQMLLVKLVQVPLAACEVSVPVRSSQHTVLRRDRVNGRTGEKAVGVLMGQGCFGCVHSEPAPLRASALHCSTTTPRPGQVARTSHSSRASR